MPRLSALNKTPYDVDTGEMHKGLLFSLQTTEQDAVRTALLSDAGVYDVVLTIGNPVDAAAAEFFPMKAAARQHRHLRYASACGIQRHL